MSTTFADDNIFLNGGTLLGSASSRIIGACLCRDTQDHYKIFLANDEDGHSGYNFQNHTLYGPQESGAGWLQYDTGKITSTQGTTTELKGMFQRRSTTMLPIRSCTRPMKTPHLLHTTSRPRQ
jgi:hypothetical protein